MKKFMYITVICLFPIVAYADCWQVSDTDRRNFCLGISKNDSNYCWQINNNNKRQYCLAIIKKDSNHCWQIDDNDSRQECLTFVGM